MAPITSLIGYHARLNAARLSDKQNARKNKSEISGFLPTASSEIF
jgi:hypothetical protein